MYEQRTSAIVLIIFILAASCEKVHNEKTNCRRALGLVPYPRTGRSLEIDEFQRADRSSGFIHHPRVGRADLPIFRLNANRRYDFGSEQPTFEFIPFQEASVDSSAPLNLGYEDFYSTRPTTSSRLNEWIYSLRKMDNPRVFYDGDARGPRNRQRESTMGAYGGRDADSDTMTITF